MMTTKHYKNERYKREKFIEKYLGEDGKVIDNFIVDKGHYNGIERHEITENGVILIYNHRTNLLVTKLVARPNQIKRYYENIGREPPKWLLQLALWHQSLNYNR